MSLYSYDTDKMLINHGRSLILNLMAWREQAKKRPFALHHLSARDVRQWQQHRQ